MNNIMLEWLQWFAITTNQIISLNNYTAFPAIRGLVYNNF